jgi:hypothetical protein
MLSLTEGMTSELSPKAQPLAHGIPAALDRRCVSRILGLDHWLYFDEVLADPSRRDICILGVYQGRDIAYMAEAIQRARPDRGRRPVFGHARGGTGPKTRSDSAGKRLDLGPPPSLDLARWNLASVGLDKGVELIQASATGFLKSHQQAFDFIYVDIAHDYESTRDAIASCIGACREDGVIGGDDYSDKGTWSVKKAVEASFPRHKVWANWIWLAEARDHQVPL